MNLQLLTLNVLFSVISCAISKDNKLSWDFYINVVDKYQLKEVTFILDPRGLHQSSPMRVKNGINIIKEMSSKTVVSSVISSDQNVKFKCRQNRKSGIIVTNVTDLKNMSRFDHDTLTLMLTEDPMSMSKVKTRLRFDNNFIFFHPKDEEVDLYEAYQIHKGVPPTVHKVGFWTKSKFEIPLLEKWDRRQDMSGVKIRMAALHSPPYILASRIQGKRIAIKGYLADIWNILKTQANFT